MSQYPAAGFLRRVAAAVYDALLVIALMMVITFIALPLSGGDAIPAGNLAYQLLMLATAAVFFIGFWCRGGQTLGMRTWRIRVERRNGDPLSWATGAVRFGAALFSVAALGLGFFWLLVDRDRLTWHDRIAGTRVVVLPRAA